MVEILAQPKLQHLVEALAMLVAGTVLVIITLDMPGTQVIPWLWRVVAVGLLGGGIYLGYTTITAPVGVAKCPQCGHETLIVKNVKTYDCRECEAKVPNPVYEAPAPKKKEESEPTEKDE